MTATSTTTTTKFSELSDKLEAEIKNLDTKKQAAADANNKAAQANRELSDSQTNIEQLRADMNKALDEELGVARSERVR